MKHKIVTGIAILIIFAGIGGAATNGTSTTIPNSATTTAGTVTPTVTPAPVVAPAPAPVIPTRQVTGVATNLGAGTFVGNKDIPVGLYEVSSTSGSGNFTITSSSGNLNVNEILGVSDGLGVAEIRTPILSGDVINISGINQVHFQPVTAPFITTVQTVVLHAGTWIAGQDVAPGRYLATATSGSGNFTVTGSDGSLNTNEILGVSDGIGVASVTIDLNSGDVINVSGLNLATLTPAK